MAEEDQSKIILTVHDEIESECHVDYLEQTKRIHEKAMKDAGEILIPGMPVFDKCKVENYWAK